MVGARPRTLPAAVAPVLVGTAVAGGGGPVWAWRAAAALVVALALQVGVNYANDYQDGVRGTDRERVGPTRLVATGLASPRAVRRAALVSAAAAAAAGLALAAAVQPWLIAVGAACILAAWAYTGGPRPYGYAGFGEVFVFVFFGVVAVTGSAYVEAGHLSALALGASVPVGLLATALLVVNNLRDRVGDDASGKRTLAVRLGDRPTRLLYVGLVVGALACPLVLAVVATPWALLALVATPLAVAPVRRVLTGATGPDLIAVLGRTGRLQLAFAVALLGRALGPVRVLGPPPPRPRFRPGSGPRCPGRRRVLRSGRRVRPRAPRPRGRSEPMAVAMASARARKASSLSPATANTGMASSDRRAHSGSWAPVPARRRLAANPATVFSRRASTPAELSSRPAKSGAGQPPADELGHSHLLQLGGQGLVVTSPRPALGRVLDARRPSDQDEGLHPPGIGQRQMQAQPRPHRVADVGGGPPGRGREAGPRRPCRRPARPSGRGRGHPPAPPHGGAPARWPRAPTTDRSG